MKVFGKTLSFIFLFFSILSIDAEFSLDQDEAMLLHLRAFGRASISKMLFDYIRSIMPERGTLLEMGSGWASGEFSKYYTVFSVEHAEQWLNKYPTNYIYAPIKNGWYDVKILQASLPQNYNCILIDGPTGKIGRYGFYHNLDLFKKDVPYIFDDVDRTAEYVLMADVAEVMGRSFTIFEDEVGKRFGVILP
jgi:hypothetical protein